MRNHKMGLVSALGLFLLLVGLLPTRLQGGPHLEEVIRILKAEFPETTDSEIDRAAVEGLMARLGPKVSLASAPIERPEEVKAITKAELLDSAYAYFRISRLDGTAHDQFLSELESLKKVKEPRGMIFDLRYAQDSDYAAAARLADPFFPEGASLLDFGNGMVNATPKPKPITVPVILLVNPETSGAPEAFAAILRENRAALLVGQSTAGKASMAREFKLSTGDTLRVATTPLKLKSGELPMKPLSPDVQVVMDPAVEREFYKDPYYVVTREVSRPGSQASSLTNLFSRRTSEAELVKRHREGAAPDPPEKTSQRADPILKPQIQDPALLRALDLLKGLTLLQPAREP